MYQGDTILNQLQRNKPKEFGPWKVVHNSLKQNLERLGVNPVNNTLNMPLWEKGGSTTHNYAKSLNGTITGADWANSGLDFNTSLDRIGCGNAGNFLQATGTIAFRYQKVTTPGSYYYWASVDDDYQEFSLLKELGTTMNFYINGTNAGFSSSVIGDGEVHDVVFTWDADNNTRDFYLDGDFVSQNTLAFTWDTSGIAAYNFILGGRLTGSERFAGGIISTFGIYTEVLNQVQIASLSDNPWQLWQPKQPVIYNIGAAALTTLPPTTLSPTTIAPTTLSPTTIAPTSLAPTTDVTTILPTTLPPTTLSPTTLQPTTLAPTTVPTTAAPTTLAPTTLSPTTIPTTTPPTTILPTTIWQTTAAPTTIAPTTLSPTTIAPTTAEPTTTAPTTLPTTSPPTTLEPTTIAPTTLPPTTLAPTTTATTVGPTTTLTTAGPTTAPPSIPCGDKEIKIVQDNLTINIDQDNLNIKITVC